MTLFFIMEELDLNKIDLSLYQKQEGRQRVSTDTLNDRVYLKKTEQLYHRKHSSSYIIIVLVQKFIDDTPVNSWSWIQPLTQEELRDFPLPPSTHKKYNKELEHQKYQDRKEYYKQYYQQHRNPDTPTRDKSKKWSELTPDEIRQIKREQARIYYQLNREKVLERKRQYNKTHKEQKKQYNQTHKEVIKKANRNYYINHIKNK